MSSRKEVYMLEAKLESQTLFSSYITDGFLSRFSFLFFPFRPCLQAYHYYYYEQQIPINIIALCTLKKVSHHYSYYKSFDYLSSISIQSLFQFQRLEYLRSLSIWDLTPKFKHSNPQFLHHNWNHNKCCCRLCFKERSW